MRKRKLHKGSTKHTTKQDTPDTRTRQYLDELGSSNLSKTILGLDRPENSKNFGGQEKEETSKNKSRHSKAKKQSSPEQSFTRTKGLTGTPSDRSTEIDKREVSSKVSSKERSINVTGQPPSRVAGRGTFEESRSTKFDNCRSPRVDGREQLRVGGRDPLAGRELQNHSHLGPASPENSLSKNSFSPNGKKITDKQLLQCLELGWSYQKIANEFSMSKNGVFKRVKSLGKKSIPFVLQKHSDIIGPQLKTMEQLAMINEEALSYIQDKNLPKILKMQAMKRVEAQNEMQLRIMQLMHSVNEVKEFQRIVLEVIGELEPEARKKVIEKLRSRKSAAAVLMPEQAVSI